MINNGVIPFPMSETSELKPAAVIAAALNAMDSNAAWMADTLGAALEEARNYRKEKDYASAFGYLEGTITVVLHSIELLGVDTADIRAQLER